MTETRRPIKSRSNIAIRTLAGILAKTAITPNQISAASVVFAVIAAFALTYSDRWWAMPIALAGVQLRLLCNVLDGLVAVEGGKKSAVGAIYNEFPDRAADSVLLIAAGYAAGHPSLGWAAALLAALTAYVRVFGGSLGLEQHFIGPMAKQHRMAVLSLACVLAMVETAARLPHRSLLAALVIIAAGSAITCITRTRAIASALKETSQ
jgi:phosphatidylglycerophosphate synthase